MNACPPSNTEVFSGDADARQQDVCRVIRQTMAGLCVRKVRFTVEFDPPLPAEILPASALRSILGRVLHDAAEAGEADHTRPSLFYDFFEPGSRHGHKPAAFALRGASAQMPSPQITSELTTFDRDGFLLPAMLDALDVASQQRGFRHSLIIPAVGEILALRPAILNQFSPDRADIKLLLDSPLRLRHYIGPAELGKHRVRTQLNAGELTLPYIVWSTLQRIQSLNDFYGNATFDFRALDLSVMLDFGSASRSGLFPLLATGLTSRRKRSESLDGVGGQISILSAAPALMEVLHAGSTLGIGENIPEGCGAFSLLP